MSNEIILTYTLCTTDLNLIKFGMPKLLKKYYLVNVTENNNFK